MRWYGFNAPDKKRPVLILTRNSVIEYLGEVTVAPITGTVRDIPSEVVLEERDGMPKACAVNCDHLQTVAKDKVGPLITTVSHQKMEAIRRAVLFALNL